MFGDLYIHYGKLISGEIKKGDQADLKIDLVKRQNIRANHSATHLLHESLRRTHGKVLVQIRLQKYGLNLRKSAVLRNF